MARYAEGVKLYRTGKTHSWRARWTTRGERYDVSTGFTDRAEATREADRLRAEAESGALVKSRGTQRQRPQLLALVADWLDAARVTNATTTVAIWETYCVRWCRRWPSLDALTSAALGDYLRDRLGAVAATTVRKEISALRSLSAWLVERGHLEAPLPVPAVPRRAVGARVHERRRGDTLSPAEVDALLAQLAPRARTLATLLWETGLRPSTVRRLRYGTHWRMGEPRLRLSADLDKSRWAREVPLSSRAVAVLTSLGERASGAVLVPGSDLRHVIRAAARAIGLPRERVATLVPYDLRRARITAWLDAGASVAEVAYLVGHRSVTQVDAYARGTLEGARRVVAAETPVARVSGEDSGERGQTSSGAKGGT